MGVVAIETGVFVEKVCQLQVRAKYGDWSDPKYEGWDCSEKSVECEKFFETECELDCYLVYGHSDYGTDNWIAHIWNIVMIDGVPHEFESITLTFKEVSETCTIEFMQEGFYVNGAKHEKSQPYENWEEIFSI